MINFIFDASFVITGLLNETSLANKELRVAIGRITSKQALAFAPYLLWIEVANGLRYSTTDLDLATTTYAKFTNFPITPHEFSLSQSLAIIKLAYQTKTTVYDSSYHYLAIELDGTFLTCDKAYYRKAGSLGHIKLVDS